MNVGELIPAVQHRLAFELSVLRRLRDASGCYCLTNASGTVLYVGQAVSVRRRLVQHFARPKRRQLTSQGRISQVAWRPAEPLHLDRLERGWIAAVTLRNDRAKLNRPTISVQKLRRRWPKKRRFRQLCALKIDLLEKSDRTAKIHPGC